MKEVPLANGRGFALVDDEDYDRVSRHRWFITTSRLKSYAGRCGLGGRTILMHREILGFPMSESIDHIDGDGLNNRRTNIRACSTAENLRNQRKGRRRGSQYKGVSRARIPGLKKGWRARLVHKTIGYYYSEQEAALAYDDAAREAFGEFACVNFPKDGEQSAVA